jgi:hypothetical protein
MHRALAVSITTEAAHPGHSGHEGKRSEQQYSGASPRFFAAQRLRWTDESCRARTVRLSGTGHNPSIPKVRDIQEAC